MFFLIIILLFVLLAGLALFSLVKPAIMSTNEKTSNIPDESPATIQQKGQYQCLLPKQHSQ